MISGRKAQNSYLIAIFILTVIMGTFLYYILDVFYGDEHEKCVYLEFEIEEICSRGNVVNVDIQNFGTSVFKFKINDEYSEENIVLAGEKESFRTDYGSVEILPVIDTGVEIKACKSKIKKYGETSIGKC